MRRSHSRDFWISHLLRRAGFGTTPPELRRYRSMEYEAVVDELVNPERTANTVLEEKIKELNFDYTRLADIQRWWLYRMAYTTNPLEEKLTLFWHGHFATSNRKVGAPYAMYVQNMLLRRLGLGDFQQLLLSISRDPAMVIWLDNQQNRKGKPNENYAREIMELFTLGIGNYCEQDVKEAARSFTGWQTGPSGFRFNSKQHDAGEKKFLGERGNLNGDDIVRILADQPRTARFLSEKLLRFFVVDAPTPKLIARVADVYLENERQIRPVMSAIFRDKCFLSPAVYHSKIKSPVEVTIGAIKSLQVKHLDDSLPYQLERMGQSLFQPPNVKGWEGGAAWVSSDKMMARFNFAAAITAARLREIESQSSLSKLLHQEGIQDAADMTDYFLDLLVDRDVPCTTRQKLVEYVSKAKDGQLMETISDEKNLELKACGLLHLIMTLPVYHLC